MGPQAITGPLNLQFVTPWMIAKGFTNPNILGFYTALYSTQYTHVAAGHLKYG